MNGNKTMHTHINFPFNSTQSFELMVSSNVLYYGKPLSLSFLVELRKENFTVRVKVKEKSSTIN